MDDVIFGGVVVLGIVFCIWVGWLMHGDSVSTDCGNIGAFRVLGVGYECIEITNAD